MLDWTIVCRNERALPVNTHRLSFYQKSNKNAFSSSMLMLQLRTLQLCQPAFHSDVTNRAMVMHRCAVYSPGCNSLIRTSSLHIDGKVYYVRCTDKKSYQARFVIGPSFDRDPRTALVSPEECMSLFHPEEVSPERWYLPHYTKSDPTRQWYQCHCIHLVMMRQTSSYLILT